jgi:putative flippase GtrA
METTAAVLIPAYKPDERMLALIDALKARGFIRLIVVDDGCGEGYAPIFRRAAEAGAHVLTHPVNRGKGAALKTGLKHILATGACPVVTADADGQHAPEDVEAIARRLGEMPNALVLGVRDKSRMPARSRFGNTLTCWTLGAVSGLWIQDTQTGLRGLPECALAAFSELEGDRYEYEMSMLLRARQDRMQVEQIVIRTIYIDDNRGSSFHVLRDSVLIYGRLLRQLIAFLGSSAVAALIDLTLFTVLHILYPHLLMVAVVAARAVSATVNYLVNRNLVFRADGNARSVVRYYTLAFVMVVLSYLIIRGLSFLHIPAVPAKILGDAALLVFNYHVQRRLVFRNAQEADSE